MVKLENGKIKTSVDGQVWITQTFFDLVPVKLAEIKFINEYDDSLYIIVTEDLQIVTSSTGDVWTLST